jgi:hypothetical protein
MTNYKPRQKKNRLLVGALLATSAASVFFGTKYYSIKQPNQISQTQEVSVGERVRELYDSMAEKSSHLIPEVKKDYKKIAIYGGAGLLTGITLAYLAGRKR